MLHRLNQVRLHYIRRAIDRQFGSDNAAIRPLEGRRALDMGWAVYLLLAVLVDFDSTPYEHAASGLPGGALLIYVVTIVLCCFCLGSSWVKLRKLRVEYRLWRRSAFAAFLAAAKGDDLESRMALNISPNGTAAVLAPGDSSGAIGCGKQETGDHQQAKRFAHPTRHTR